MINFFRSILGAATLRQSGVTLSATVVNGFLGILFYIFLARSLGPYEFGIFSICVAALTLMSDISDVGTNTGIVRFVGYYKVRDKLKAYRFLKLSLEIKILVWFVVLIFGWIVMPFVSDVVLKKAYLLDWLRLSLAGVGGAILFSFATSSLQAFQKFTLWGVVNVSLNGLRLIFLIVFVYLGVLSIDSSLGIYIFFPFLGFLMSFFVLPNFLKVKQEKLVFSELFSYNKWIAIFTIIAAISSRLDIFMSTRLLNIYDVGIYAVAVNLSSIVPQIVLALATVAAPKFASFEKKSQVREYFKKFQAFVVGLSFVGLIVGGLISLWVIPNLYGSEYVASIAPFLILLLAQAIFLISVPTHTSVFYYFAYPKLFFWISIGNIFIVSIFGYALISNYSYIGASLAILLGNLFNFIVPFTWVWRRLFR